MYSGEFPKDTWNKHEKELWKLAKNILIIFKPSYIGEDDYCVQFSKLDGEEGGFVEKHEDGGDIGKQIVFSWGGYMGGCLKFEDGTEIMHQNQLVEVDGRNKHWVEKGFSGSRYSCIFFKMYDRSYNKAKRITNEVSVL